MNEHFASRHSVQVGGFFDVLGVGVMDSRGVRKILESPDRYQIKHLDAAMAWLVAQQRLMLRDARWDQTAWDKANEAIDYLLDVRLERMEPVGEPA